MIETRKTALTTIGGLQRTTHVYTNSTNFHDATIGLDVHI
jgi:hypothetical protein